MVTDQEARSERYDVIVVGGGMGGISAGAFLAKAGRKVVVLESQDGPGGYAHAFQRGPYTFDPAVHIAPQAHPGQPYDILLRALGVKDSVTFLPIDSMYGVAYPGFREHFPFGREPFIEAHERHFPGQADNLRRFWKLALQVTRESQELSPRIAFRDIDKAVAQFPTLFKYRNASLSAVVDEFVDDPKLKALVTVSWPYLGLPPNELSYFSWSGMMVAHLEDGPSYPQGSFQRVADAFVTALKRHGGEFVPRATVSKILVEDGRAAGVRLESGNVLRAPVVISNADVTHTFEELVGMEHLPASFVRNFRRLKPSLSAVILYAATSLDLRQYEAVHETFVSRHWDHNLTLRDVFAAQPGGMWFNVPTLADPSLAPPGEHIVILSSLALYDIGRPWSGERERMLDALIGVVDGVYPGFRNAVRHAELATPVTLERFGRNRQGAIYGWANTASQAGTKRPARHTPLEGLYLSGHWTQPGTGNFRAVYSGLLLASELLGYESGHDYMAELVRDAGAS